MSVPPLPEVVLRTFIQDTLQNLAYNLRWTYQQTRPGYRVVTAQLRGLIRQVCDQEGGVHVDS